MFLQDTRVIQQQCGFDVLAQQHEVLFRDGSTVQLHPVRLHKHDRGADLMFLRALHQDGLRWLVFDLRPLHPELEIDMLTHLPRDVPGIVYYTLRLNFSGARAFTTRVHRQVLASWWTHESAFAPLAAA